LKRYDERVLAEVEVVGVEVRSARRPKRKVSVEMRRPIMVRNWRCQPKESFCQTLADYSAEA
jgi:hypothetical protein